MTAGFTSFQAPASTGTPFNTLSFVIEQMMNKMCTATLAKVVAVTNDGNVAASGFVDVHPLVNQIDGAGTPTPHGVVYRVPYGRMQGGTNAVIIDPQVGDIGIVVFADRDISSVVANSDEANPGSGRRFDWADALYTISVITQSPVQYVRFSEDGIEINSPNLVSLIAPDVKIACETLEIVASTSTTITTPIFTVNGNSTLNGTTTTSGIATVASLVAVGAVAVGGVLSQGGHDVGRNHTHGGVDTGAGHTAIVD